MRFTIPQFIEHTPKIIGPLTFKQFSFIGGAGAVCFVLYFLLPKTVFLIFSLILVGGGTAMAFFKINGKSLPLVLADMFKFGFESKIYVWKKKEQPIVLYKEKPVSIKQKPEEKKESLLKVGGQSRLKKIQTNIEIKTK